MNLITFRLVSTMFIRYYFSRQT